MSRSSGKNIERFFTCAGSCGRKLKLTGQRALIAVQSIRRFGAYTCPKCRKRQ